jgi:hypothetical protein
MDPIVDMIINDAKASDITDKIKEVLYSKAAENIEALKPYVASSIFDDDIEIEEE